MNFYVFSKGDHVTVLYPYSANINYTNCKGEVIDSDATDAYVMFKNRAVLRFKNEELALNPKVEVPNKIPSLLESFINIISGKGFDLQ